MSSIMTAVELPPRAPAYQVLIRWRNPLGEEIARFAEAAIGNEFAERAAVAMRACPGGVHDERYTARTFKGTPAEAARLRTELAEIAARAMAIAA